MAIVAGNYLIRSALDDDLVLLPKEGSKAKKTNIIVGGLNETDNRCYWKVSLVTIGSTSCCKISNILSGTGSGNISYNTQNGKNIIIQDAYKADTGAWLVSATGNSISVNGTSIPTYYIKLNSNSSQYVTVSDKHDELYLASKKTDSSSQEFFFELTTYFNNKIPAPTTLTTDNEKYPKYIIHSGSTTFKPRWKSTKTQPIYELRYRSRCYDMTGTIVNNNENDGWTQWTTWTMIVATPKYNDKKKFEGTMESNTAITTPDHVDNVTYSRSEMQVQVRLTSAAKESAYTKTGTVTHGPCVSQIISQYCEPTLTITAAVYSPNGLALTYTTNYTVSGSSILINSIKSSDGTVLVKKYKFTGQKSTGDLYLNCDELFSIPKPGADLTIIATLTEENNVVSTQGTFELECQYATDHGLSIKPTYYLTDRMTILAKIKAYHIVQCFLYAAQNDGTPRWVECDSVDVETVDNNNQQKYFEIVPAYNEIPILMWVCVDSEGNWSSLIHYPEWPDEDDPTVLIPAVLSSNYYSWHWVDFFEPKAAILKYQVGEIMKPTDTIKLSGNEFITTGREYPVFHYNRSIKRTLDIEGVILNSEEDERCTKAAFESMASAKHCIYRQPDGKWYQVAIQSISFEREDQYTKISIQQEAETR